jgi:hypothetical protein
VAPFEIFRGGADKMYPEYRHRMPAPLAGAENLRAQVQLLQLLDLPVGRVRGVASTERA